MESIGGQANENQPLEQIRKGMQVYDVNNEHVGKVDLFQPAAEFGTQTLNLGPNDLPPPDVPEVVTGSVIASNFTGDVRPQAVGEESPAGIVANLFADDQLPQEVEELLQQRGFLRIHGSGLFASSYYATLDQIASVTTDRILLLVPRNGLTKI
jgi:hypothetical protein